MNSPEETTVQLEAIKAEQSGTVIYIGVGSAKKLIAVSTVDYWDPKLSPTDIKQGYQRPPERSRITRIGSYLLQNDKILFPTALLLAARKPIEFDRKQGLITLSSDFPVQIVDGQHRLCGLRYAIEEKNAKHLEDFQIPFVVIEAPNKLVEMDQFRVVNGTAKSVRTDLVNMLLTALHSNTKSSEIPENERLRIVLGNVVDRLAKTPNSPWFYLINLPGEGSSRRGDIPVKIIRATSLITSLKPVYTWLRSTIFEPEGKTPDEEIEYLTSIIIEYWTALKAVVPEAFEDPTEYVIQKTPGIFSLHKLLKLLLLNMFRGRRRFDRESFADFLQDHPEITDAQFWHVSGKRASVYGSMKGFDELFELLSMHYPKS